MVDGRPRGVWGKLISQRAILEAMQRDDQFVYAAITRENAIKIGITTNLMNRKGGIHFGGVDRYVGFMPGGIRDERRLHRALDDSGARIAGTREYYYPFEAVLPAINELRASMGIRPLRRRELPAVPRRGAGHRHARLPRGVRCGTDRGRLMSTVEQVDDSTTTELALHWAVHRAKRCVPRVGNAVLPTPWDVEHTRIDELLDMRTKAPA